MYQHYMNIKAGDVSKVVTNTFGKYAYSAGERLFIYSNTFEFRPVRIVALLRGAKLILAYS
jgi:hypothetical protein